MLKKKKTTASGKLVLVKSVRRTRSHRLNSVFKGAWGRCPQQASGEENHKGIFFPAGMRVLTQALLASIIPNQNNFGITTVLAIPHDGGGGRYRGTESP